jgi:hypothetical protein
MRPPFCAVCDEPVDPFGERGGLVSFARDPQDADWYERAKKPGFVGHPPHQEWFCDRHGEPARRLQNHRRTAALATLRRALNVLVTLGLPTADGVQQPTREYDFDLTAVDGRPLLRIPSIREDRVLWIPEHWEQQDWLLGAGLHLQESGLELSWWLTDDAVTTLVRTLAPVALGVPDALRPRL